MKKRIGTLVICICLCVMQLSSVVFAAEGSFDQSKEKVIIDGYDITVDKDEEIYKALNGITDLESVPMNMEDGDVAVIIDEIGNIIPVEVYSTTKEIILPSKYSVDMEEDTSKVYATTNVAVYSSDKSDSGSVNDYYVTAYATIYWRDNLGVENEFLSASGGWDADTNPSTGKVPSLSSRSVTLKGTSSATNYHQISRTPKSNTFEIAGKDFTYKQWQYALYTSVKVNSKDTLKLTVVTGILT